MSTPLPLLPRHLSPSPSPALRILPEQALELNDDSKPEQLISFLDNVCKLRCGGHRPRRVGLISFFLFYFPMFSLAPPPLPPPK